MASKDSSKSLPWGLNKDGLAPGSMKTISESKLKAFDVGLMNSSVKKTSKKTKQDIEEKKKAEEEACAEVYADFLASFESSAATSKAFVRGSTINPEKKAVEARSSTAYPQKSVEAHSSTAYPQKYGSPSSGKVYKPVSRFSPLVSSPTDTKTKLEPQKSELPKKKKTEKEKKKSNLELFKEELKRQQEEREIRHKLKKGEIPGIDEDLIKNMPLLLKDDLSSSFGSFDVGDPSTTNLYIGNINPKMNEEMLMKLFGKYGPLASVKIMWPRTDEEKSRNRNCGFVAYMLRKDGEKALKSLNGKLIMEFEMKLGWGKSVPIPPHPIYIPPDLQEASKPPPPSGLPFNAQIARPAPGEEVNEDPSKLDSNGINIETLANAVVKVVIPQERNILCLIHRMIEFVVREGPMFEAMIMNKEINNPMYRFLFDNQSCEHIYYRWKLFSILQGDSPTKWHTGEICMFSGGSVWRPPQCSQYSYYRAQSSDEPAEVEAQPQEHPPPRDQPSPRDQPPSRDHPASSASSSHSSSSTHNSSSKRGVLSSRQRDKLEDTLRGLTLDRTKVADSMLWCLEHADAAEEIVECIAESLSLIETPPVSKVARLYLVSDILHNCSAKVPNASFFRRGFETKLVEIFANAGDTFRAIKGRMRAETFKKQVLRCLTAWIDWAVYPMDYLIKLQNIFIGEPEKSIPELTVVEDQQHLIFLDGIPLGNPDLDGIPIGVDLDGAPLDGMPMKGDIDGAPMEDLDGAPLKKEPRGVFMASRWETADLEEEQNARLNSTETDRSSTGRSEQAKGSSKHLSVDVDEIKRKKLREIEIKVAEFSERLEAMGAAKSGINIKDECDKYRAQLLEEAAPKKDKKKKEGSCSTSPSSRHDSKRKRSRSRSPGGHKSRRSRSRSGSPPSRSSPRHSDHSDSPLATSLLSLKSYNSRSPSPSTPKGAGDSRDKARSRSRTPEDKRKRRSRSPPSARSKKRSRSRSKSPKIKKNKRRSRSRSPAKSKSSSSKKSKR